MADYPWSGIALLGFGGFTMLADVALGAYAVVVDIPGLVIFCCCVLIWVAFLWLMVLSGVRDEWPRTQAKEGGHPE